MSAVFHSVADLKQYLAGEGERPSSDIEEMAEHLKSLEGRPDWGRDWREFLISPEVQAYFDSWDPCRATTTTERTTTMTTEQTKKTITIKLSETSPVKIDPEQWPLIASGKEMSSPADGDLVWRLKVRAHADGRRLVYAQSKQDREAARCWPIFNFQPARVAYLLPAGASEEQTICAIRMAAKTIGNVGLGAKVISKLPAREI